MTTRLKMPGPQKSLVGLAAWEQTLLPVGSGRVGATARSLTAPLVGRSLADVEQDLILDTLSHCLGNRTQAAALLGISIRTLRNKLKLYSDAGSPVPAPGESGHGETRRRSSRQSSAC
jgi:DNA-binding NtrC family response regulator